MTSLHTATKPLSTPQANPSTICSFMVVGFLDRAVERRSRCRRCNSSIFLRRGRLSASTAAKPSLSLFEFEICGDAIIAVGAHEGGDPVIRALQVAECFSIDARPRPIVVVIVEPFKTGNDRLATHRGSKIMLVYMGPDCVEVPSLAARCRDSDRDTPSQTSLPLATSRTRASGTLLCPQSARSCRVPRQIGRTSSFCCRFFWFFFFVTTGGGRAERESHESPCGNSALRQWNDLPSTASKAR